MANPEHLAILKQGVEVWNEWRKNNPDITPDLSGADLHEARLLAVDFRRADLKGANLDKATLNRANLSGSNLAGATLRKAMINSAKIGGANLVRVDFRRAGLSGTYFNGSTLLEANLSKTSLTAAIFTNANLSGADLSRAHLGGTSFGDTDLSATKGLDTVKHFGPSTIGVDTIYRSRGIIPEAFLRGVGVPDDFILYISTLVGKPIQFYSCFISHSSKDRRFCERLYTDLQSKGVHTWYFPEDAKWGELVWEEIDQSIKRYNKLVVICSKNSLQSGPTLREMERALVYEDEERKNILFPIAIDKYIFNKWQHPRKADVLAKVVGTDFIGWNRSTAKYDAALKKLLKALKAE